MALSDKMPSELPKQVTDPLLSAAAGVQPATSSVVMVVIVLSQPAAFGMILVVDPIWAGSQVSALMVAVVA